MFSRWQESIIHTLMEVLFSFVKRKSENAIHIFNVSKAPLSSTISYGSMSSYGASLECMHSLTCGCNGASSRGRPLSFVAHLYLCRCYAMLSCWGPLDGYRWKYNVFLYLCRRVASLFRIFTCVYCINAARVYEIWQWKCPSIKSKCPSIKSLIKIATYTDNCNTN